MAQLNISYRRHLLKTFIPTQINNVGTLFLWFSSCMLLCHSAPEEATELMVNYISQMQQTLLFFWVIAYVIFPERSIGLLQNAQIQKWMKIAK